MASLQPGIQVITAPRFHIKGEWTDRLSLNSGIEINDQQIYPRNDWRLPAQHELDLLTTDPADPIHSIQLFAIPDRLQAQWWSLAAESLSELGMESEAFKKFAKDVHEFLLFKQMPLPSECAFEVILTAPGQSSARANAAGLLAGQGTALLGGINLSDEEASVVFLNHKVNPGPDTTSTSIEEQQRTLLLENRDYPLTRIKLRAREGYWLPTQSIIMDRDTRGRTEIDVHLAIRRLPSPSPPNSSPQGRGVGG
jgi:hypothetical protein